MYTPIRIVIADDHDIFRKGFKLLLADQRELELAGEADNGRELLQLVRDVHPDVVMMDIQMPVMDGIEATRALKNEFPHIGVIALSMFNDDNLIVDMLEAGARGYLLKNTNKHELLQAARCVYEGTAYYCMATSDKLARMIAESRFNPYRAGQKIHFTDREQEIIRLLCMQYTNKEMAETLNLSIRTVETHREKIQEKTGARNSIGIVIYALKHHLVRLDELNERQA